MPQVKPVVLRFARRLGLIHREVGVSQQRVNRPFLGLGDRQADADRDQSLDAGEDKRGRYRPAETRCGLTHSFSGGVRETQHELIATEPSEEVTVADHRRQALRDRGQQLVAGVVTQRVVDNLEIVDVDEQRRDRGISPGLEQRLGRAR